MRTAVGVAAVVVLIVGTFAGFVAGLRRHGGESTRATVTMALSNDEWRRVQSEAVAWMVANGSPYVDVDDAVRAWLVNLVRRTVA